MKNITSNRALKIFFFLCLLLSGIHGLFTIGTDTYEKLRPMTSEEKHRKSMSDVSSQMYAYGKCLSEARAEKAKYENKIELSVRARDICAEKETNAGIARFLGTLVWLLILLPITIWSGYGAFKEILFSYKQAFHSKNT